MSLTRQVHSVKLLKHPLRFFPTGAVIDDDICSGRSKHERNRGANTTPAAGNEGDLVGKIDLSGLNIPADSLAQGSGFFRFHLIIFLAELNGLKTWATDIGNAYLEAKTFQKLYIITGPEFGELERHTIIIFKP